MENNTGNKILKKPYIIAAIIVAAIIVVILVLSFTGVGGTSSRIIDGVEYIKGQEAVDVISLENDIYEVKKQMYLAEIDEKIAEDPDYVWTALSQINTVFMGDSRAVAYEAYGFVDSSRCLADGGESMKVIPDHYWELQTVNPKLLILAYGLNDTGWWWHTPEEFAEDMMAYVDEIHSFLPDCKIYIQSIILPREGVDEAFDNPGLYERVREWNTREMELYDEAGYDYIDIGDLVEEHADLFLDDGIHFSPDFYPILATEILKRYMSDAMERND